ncbi:HprK-related kinase B [Chachezhania sediminis]|uniref:HprK-related kinase B n=1 Tax=Chachezhania sediminis TaxID=2599291 RepID=UPI00131C12A1|nr:HprK-related kinase B [Chachezhania sediminis]
MTTRVSDILDRLDLSPLKGTEPIFLKAGDIHLTLRCPAALRADLAAMLAPAVVGEGAEDCITIHVLDCPPLTDLPPVIPWAREPGKVGRKDAYADLADGRLVVKVRTGMAFLLGQGVAVAFGPAGQNLNQIVNFANSQILGAAQRDGWQIAHAAAVTDGLRGLAVSGLSGGGKSTTILRLMDMGGLSYVTNDRLLLRAASDGARGLGVPKPPRINPGTILGNPRLHGLLTPARLAEVAAMDKADLWSLEDKHDVDIDAVYGAGRTRLATVITHYWVLNWRHDTDAPTLVRPVSLHDRPDLLPAIMKSPGVFYHKPDGSFLADTETPLPAGYLDALRNVAMFEVTGRVDFDALADAGRTLFARAMAT